VNSDYLALATIRPSDSLPAASSSRGRGLPARALHYNGDARFLRPAFSLLTLRNSVAPVLATPRAITDLELAIQYGCLVFLPYLLLAHHYVVTGRFQDCLDICYQATRRQPSAVIQSELAEWTAVAQAELVFPAESVRASLEKATRLDPSNDRARHNLVQFEDHIRSARPATWATRPAAAVRTSGQAERQLSMAA
jgi:hypothetical protein